MVIIILFSNVYYNCNFSVTKNQYEFYKETEGNTRAEDTEGNDERIYTINKKGNKIRKKNKKRIIREFTLDCTSKTEAKLPEYLDICDSHLMTHFAKPVYKQQLKKIYFRNSLGKITSTKGNSFQNFGSPIPTQKSSKETNKNPIKRPGSHIVLNPKMPPQLKTKFDILLSQKLKNSSKLRESTLENNRYLLPPYPISV